ncbi:AraC family transcriptional regulator [Sphingomonas sanguinis]|uniref:AraC family transcriptional regulator n=1 Tax=Sphingomonas sanguinis TaxID=33051 RepID=A0ABU5LT48_9SPHN|nr:AraC family transcriptional regulator [Sphingomonas sanguinis]MDZ7283103.1 AraC family transcriptional regulator [Sphingomonas sanguinis]
MTMDPLSDVLRLLKPASFGFRGLNAGGSWQLQFPASAGIKAYAIESGTCWMLLDAGGDPVRLGPGDVMLLPGRSAFKLYTSTTTEPIDAFQFFPSFPVGTTGTINGGGDCFGIGGFFDFEGRHVELLLDVLPAAVYIRSEASRATLGVLIGRLMQELREPQLGSSLIAGHLAQTLLVEALRLHLADQSAQARGWLAALGDLRIRAALSAMHADPAKPWRLTDLAKTAGMSRSSFAARFRETLGETPLEYLTRWRMMLAADRLAQGQATLAVVAPMVGYESESALGAAFKRVLGQSPRQFVKAITAEA